MPEEQEKSLPELLADMSNRTNDEEVYNEKYFIEELKRKAAEGEYSCVFTLNKGWNINYLARLCQKHGFEYNRTLTSIEVGW